MPSLYGAPPNRPPLWGSAGWGHPGSLWQPFGEDQCMTASSFGYEAALLYFEPRFFQPGNVRRPVGVAPVHRRAVPIVVGPGPSSRSQGRKKEAARLEPAMNFSEDRRLLLEWQVDDREERHDRPKVLRGEINGGHISARKLRPWNEPTGALDLDG